MKVQFSILLLLTLVLSQTGCKETHFLKDPKYRAEVDSQFLKQKSKIEDNQSGAFDIFKRDMTTQQEEAMKFLYAYMPLNDLADYSGEFFFDIVNITLKGRKEMAWGKTIPDDVFRHFVLPYRINNENLDTFRVSMYDVLKQRIQGMDMKQAALEINHWCHEKVTYRGTDMRTSAPLSLMRTSWGRCGEESTFAVSALRTVGIPARQCYTPRWAHCDDNHAWVEVWVDGKWYFLGACEPEPDLNMGWFAEPARRAMLVHTRAFGAYLGSEKVVDQQKQFSELNLTEHYAPVKTIYVKVKGENGNSVDGARVEFQLYNYAEFYPIATKTTDKKGLTHLRSGLGDLLVWASKDNVFGYKKMTVENCDTLTIVLDRRAGKSYSESFDMVPPIERVPRSVDEAGRKKNNQRLKDEDRIRNKYMATFMDSLQAAHFADTLNLDTKDVCDVIERSTGNWRAIVSYLRQGVRVNRDLTLPLLDVLADKDLRDTPTEVLMDHLSNSNQGQWEKDLFVQNILNPRIANELVTPYRSFIKRSFDAALQKKIQQDPNELIQWIKSNIHISDEGNYYRTPISPIGVLKLGMTDLYSLNILFVAVCRSFDIPARLNEATRVPEYFKDGFWRSVYFKDYKQEVSPKGKLHLINPDRSQDPQYYMHWTLARFEDGKYQTLEYEWGKKFSQFPSSLELEVGEYMLVTGYRKNDGTVLSHMQFFAIAKGKTITMKLNIRKEETLLKPLGMINLNKDVKLFDNKKVASLKHVVKGKIGIVAWIDPDKEPTKHLMVDLSQLKGKFEKWGGSFVLLMDKQKVSETFTSDFFKNIPSQCLYAYDVDLGVLSSLEKSQQQNLSSHYPVIAVVDNKGNYYFLSHGYKIGVGEQLLKTLSRMK